MTSPVSAVEAIEKAMEGVTPGPWDFEPIDEHSVRPTVTTIGDYRVVRSGRGSRGYDLHGVDEVDAAYIAACSPDRMREVLASQAEALKRENAELRRLVENGQSFANQIRSITCHLNGQAYSSTVSELNQFDADLRRARTLLKEEANAGN